MKRAKFNLGSYHLNTCDMGQLIPVGIHEVLPGDSFQHSTNVMMRLSPMAAPVMHPVSVRIHHFFVPHRLVWQKAGATGTFEDFITSGEDGDDAQTVPTQASQAIAHTVQDYYGIPLEGGVQINAMPNAGYNLIYNEFYRDQDLVPERGNLDRDVANIAWEKDYQTSARPWPQKGPDITLPVAGAAPVYGLGQSSQAYSSGVGTPIYETGGKTTEYSSAATVSTTLQTQEDPANAGFPNIYADLSQAEAVKVNEFRKAFALQRYAEARARYGSRYTEYLRYLGVTPNDARLDRPEYLGGGRANVAISEVLQTAPEATGRDFGVGDMYGHGIAALRSNAYRKMFVEHGYVHTLLSVRPKAIYAENIDRHWLRQTREDFWQRELQHIGQQVVQNNEVKADDQAGTGTFGYQDRYMEYRGAPSQIHGEFRGILNYWHLAREFVSPPVLNESFVQCSPSKRIFNEQTTHSLWNMVQHRLVARRLVSRRASSHIF